MLRVASLSLFGLVLSLAGCAAEVGAGEVASAPLEDDESAIHFERDWTEWIEGPLEVGRTLRIEYDVERMRCRGTRYGREAWTVVIHYRMNGGPEQTQPIFGHEAFPGANVRTIELSEEGTLELWFDNSSVWGCHEWDSSYGENYRFEIGPDPDAPGWIGNAAVVISRATCDAGPCDRDRRSPEGVGFRYETYARQRAAIRVVDFDVWKAGVTDFDNPDLWRDLDVRVHYRYGSDAEWQWRYVDFARRVGNDARYEIDLRALDPLGASAITDPAQCPTMPLTHDESGTYVQAPFEYYVSVNGTELRASDGSAFRGTYEDYASAYALCVGR
jgi:hypothetical protein